VVTLIDRLVHKSELVKIAGKSYRSKEAAERANERASKKTGKNKKKEEKTSGDESAPSS
jgi:hypothetical protein